MMSAATALAGWFPPIGEEIWNDDLKWNPIPIYAIPASMDHLLWNGRVCDRYNQEQLKMMNSPEYQVLLQSYQKLFGYLEKHSGAPIKTFMDVNMLRDTLLIEQSKNLT